MTAEELSEQRESIDLANAEIARGEFYTYELRSAGKEAFLEDAKRGGRELGRQRAESRKCRGLLGGTGMRGGGGWTGEPNLGR